MTILVFDTCAVFIILIFIISAIHRRQTKGRTNALLFALMCMMEASTFLDSLSGALQNYAPSTHFSVVVMYLVNFLYFLTHNMVLPLYVCYIYSSVDIWHVFVRHKKLRIVWWTLTIADAVLLVLNLPLDIVFTISNDVVYHRGPAVAVYYVVAFVFAAWGIAIVLKYRKIINKDKAVVLIMISPIIFAGLLIQMILPNVLMEGFAVSIGLLIFMVIVRREENQIDPVTGAIKYNEGIDKVSKNFVTHKPVTTVLVKIVNYNNIRLYLGQVQSNEFLRTVTQRFYELMRKHSLSGEIYYLENGLYSYLIEGSDLDRARYVAMDTHEYFEGDLRVGDFLVKPEIKVCIVRCPQDIEDFSTLFTLGLTFHQTMVSDKKFYMYSDYKDDITFKIRNEMEEIIARGLKNGNFSMYYQPIYSTVEKRFISAEALIRLNDEVYGNISPGLFLPVAEMSGAIHEIGDFVLREVIRFASECNMPALGLKYLEMNLSAAQCIEVDLVDKITNLLDTHRISPERISLELTETAADINPAIVDHNIKILHELGVRIALDDYGTGYSNIKRVTSLPIDQVKLDKSFIDMVDDEGMWIVIQDTVNMLKAMGKEILVEGIEEETVARRFTDIDTDLIQGCDLVQGFYFCKPLPEEEFIDFIRSYR